MIRFHLWCILTLGVAQSACAQAAVRTSPAPATPSQVVEQFHAALAAGDTIVVARLLDPAAIVLESGDFETRAEYLAHHLPADVEFARSVHTASETRRVETKEGMAWVASTSRSSGQFEGRAVDSDGAELVVLARSPDGWRIVAIHWSAHRHRP